jgi:predicted esterase
VTVVYCIHAHESLRCELLLIPKGAEDENAPKEFEIFLHGAGHDGIDLLAVRAKTLFEENILGCWGQLQAHWSCGCAIHGRRVSAAFPPFFPILTIVNSDPQRRRNG